MLEHHYMILWGYKVVLCFVFVMNIEQELDWELEMSGKEEKAVQMLMKKLSTIERDMPLGEEALNLRRLLVELLIYQVIYISLQYSSGRFFT